MSKSAADSAQYTTSTKPTKSLKLPGICFQICTHGGRAVPTTPNWYVQMLPNLDLKSSFDHNKKSCKKLKKSVQITRTPNIKCPNPLNLHFCNHNLQKYISWKTSRKCSDLYGYRHNSTHTTWLWSPCDWNNTEITKSICLLVHFWTTMQSHMHTCLKTDTWEWLNTARFAFNRYMPSFFFIATHWTHPPPIHHIGLSLTKKRLLLIFHCQTMLSVKIFWLMR